MINVRKIDEPTCVLYGPDDKVIGVIDSYLSLTDVRIQVKKLGKKEAYSGYYVVFNCVKINILCNGNMEKWPVGFYDTYDKQLDELIDV